MLSIYKHFIFYKKFYNVKLEMIYVLKSKNIVNIYQNFFFLEKKNF